VIHRLQCRNNFTTAVKKKLDYCRSLTQVVDYGPDRSQVPYELQRHSVLKRKLMDEPFKIDFSFCISPYASLFSWFQVVNPTSHG
jgi:hypothetical protein